ncbi:hypothetical protein LTR85_003756 [Meristemomyces frigidus]|nr:hypothetical protein LTR85_003756 [Meristemomyces frigidus]
MVEPLTAAGTAASVLQLAEAFWKLGNAVYQLYNDTIVVDETVKSLIAEVNALGTACDLVFQELNSILAAPKTSSHSTYDKDGRLWSCIVAEVERSKQTLHDFELIVDRVKEESQHFLTQARRQIRLNVAKDQMLALRQRLRSHMDSLHTVLLTVNVKVAHFAPGVANETLLATVNELKEMILKLQHANDSAELHDSSTHTDFDLVLYATDVVMSGSTLYEASVANGSVQGGHGAADTNIRVAKWVGTCESLRRDQHISDPSEGSSYASTGLSGEEDTSRTTGDTPVTHGAANDDGDSLEPLDYDSDDALSIKLVQTAIREGGQAYAQGQWREADASLQEALDLLQRLPTQLCKSYDVFDLQHKLAVCAYHTEEPAFVEEALASLVRELPQSDDQRRVVCDARHMLAHVYIRMGKLDLAETACETALKGRLRLLGEEHDSTLTSLALMSRVYQLLGKPARANLYKSMIPAPQRASLVAATESLDVEGSLAEPSSTSGSSAPRPEATGAESEYEGRWLTKLKLRSKTTLEHLICVDNLDIAMTSLQVGTSSALPKRYSSTRKGLSICKRCSREIKNMLRYQCSSCSFLTFRWNLCAPCFECSSHKHPKNHFVPNHDIKPLASAFGFSQDDGTPTALHFAALFGDVELAQTLIERGFSLECYFNSRKYTPLGLAVLARRTPMVELICKYYAVAGRTPEHLVYAGTSVWNTVSYNIQSVNATECADVQEIIDTVECLARFGYSFEADPRSDQLINTALLASDSEREARRYDQQHLVSYLLSKGAKVLPEADKKWYVGSNCFAPLYHAVKSGPRDVVTLLLKNQSAEQLRFLNTNVLKPWERTVERTALYVAVERVLEDPKTPLDIVQALLEAGADVHAETYEHTYGVPRHQMFSKLEKTVVTTPLQLAERHSGSHADLLALLRIFDPNSPSAR